MKKDIKTLAALLIASVTFVACSSDDDSINENQQPVNPTVKYTMTINVSKGDDATTRALTPDGHTLNATWAVGENVYVQKAGAWATGSLQPQEAGTSTTLKGTLSGISFAADDVLTLQFPRSGAISYAGQVGTLADIAEKYDYATASVTVASISASGNINPEAATTTFTNQQAIIKFTLLDKANDAAISPTALTVTDATSTVELTSIPAATHTANGADNVLYVAFPAAGSAKTVTLTATVGDDTYTYEKSGVTFTNGQYYEITVKMTKVKPAATVTTAPTAKTGVKAGQNEAIVNAGTVEGGTMMYMVNATQPASTDGFSATVPTAEGLTAGTYYVWYYVKADDSHTDSEISATGIEVTIEAAGPKAAAEATAEDKGKLIGTDGKIYADVAAATAAGTTAVAKIIYLGTTGHATYTHGLALALVDVYEDPLTWDNSGDFNEGKTAAEWCSEWNTSKHVKDAEWMLPSKDQWDYMINAAGGYNALRDGGSNLQESYWSSTENKDNSNLVWFCDFVNCSWGDDGNKGIPFFYVRACLAF